MVVIRGDAEVVVWDLERVDIVQDGGKPAMVDGGVQKEERTGWDTILQQGDGDV